MPNSNADHVTSVEDLAPVPAAEPRFDVAEIDFDVVDDPARLEAEWRLLEVLPRNSLHQSFDWCTSWWSAHRTTPLVLRGRIGGRTVMILPFERTTQLTLRIATMPGGRFNNLNSGLFSDDFPDPSPEEFRSIVKSARECLAGQTDLVLIDTLAPDWEGIRHPLAGLATAEHPTRTFQLPLLSGIDKTIRQLHAKTRNRRYRIQRRRLEAAGGYDHVNPASAEEQHALLDLFFQQKARRFAASSLPDVFQPAQVRAFLHQLIDRSQGRRDGILSMHAIQLRGENEGAIAAIAALSRKGGHVLCQFSSIDDTLVPEASPGELLFRLMIEQAIEDGATLFDFGLGDQPYKRGWCTRETVLYDILMPVTWRGRLASPLFAALPAIKGAVKKSPGLYSTIQKLRVSLIR